MLSHTLRVLPAPTVPQDQPLDGKHIMAYLSRGAFIGRTASDTAHRAYLYSMGPNPHGRHPEWIRPIQSSLFEALIQLELITTHATPCHSFTQSYQASFRLPRLVHQDHEQPSTPCLPSLPALHDEARAPHPIELGSEATCCSQCPSL